MQVHPRSAEIFSNNVIVRTSSHLPRQSNTRYTSVWVERFQTTAASAILHESEMQVNCYLPKVGQQVGCCRSAIPMHKKINETASSCTRGHEKNRARLTPLNFRIRFFVLKREKSIPNSSTWLPMDFLKSLLFLKAGVAE